MKDAEDLGAGHVCARLLHHCPKQGEANYCNTASSEGGKGGTGR
jgi:hypothetical protein